MYIGEIYYYAGKRNEKLYFMLRSIKMKKLSEFENQFMELLKEHREELETRAENYKDADRLDELFLMKTKIAKLDSAKEMLDISKHSVNSFVADEISSESNLYKNLLFEYYIINIELMIKILQNESKSHRLNGEEKEHNKREAEIQTLKLIELKFKKSFGDSYHKRTLFTKLPY